MARMLNYRPTLEALDDRSMPSIALAAGVVTAVGTGGADAITVWKPTAETLRVEIASTGESRTFNAANVTRVLVRGGLGNDTILVGDGVKLATELYGGRGADNIQGGGGADTVRGGRGADTIGGRGGNDNLGGDNGNDVIRGDDGNDTIDGGLGIDACRGDLGTDTIAGGFDFDNQMIAAFQTSQGDAEYRFVASDPARRRFDLQVSGLAANATGGVFIDGVRVGTITTNGSGAGQLIQELDFDVNNDDFPDLPAGFPEIHVGSVVQVKLNGSVVREGSFIVNPNP